MAQQTAIFAGGCFWCTEAVFQKLEGVESVVSGYTGGTRETANYEAVCSGNTGHAEAIEIIFDSEKVSYEQLLQVFFLAAHDPTQLNAQGADQGTQYRSEIFYSTPEQKQAAESAIAELTEAKVYPAPIVTAVSALGTFYPAETHHQNFCNRNPNYPYVLFAALPKVDKVKKQFTELLKK